MMPVHFRRFSLPILALAITVIAMHPATATVPPGGTEYLNKALQGFIMRLEKSKETKLPPRLSNTEDAKVLEALWNVPAIIGQAPYKATDLPVLMDIMQQQAQITTAYTQFSPDPQKQADTKSNSIAFQDEIIRSTAAMISFISATLEAAGNYASSAPADKNGKAQTDAILKLRLGLQQVINGSALMLSNPELNAHNQERLAQALAGNASVIAASISLQDRTMLSNIVKGAKPVLRETARQSADQFIATMGNKDCTGLCALH
ncbi:hypothetical protein [Pseudochrobactrum asaccharolyticum]|uniref:hypothetical protein n=1 Tax=Pseudochrobactrum asaccharolyticum TaxID=354351 RepID=UPI0040414D41